MAFEDPEPSVPPHVLALSRAALDLHDPSLRVARLAADSLLDPWLTPARGGDRRLLFCADEFHLDVTLRPSAEGLGLLVALRSEDCPFAEGASCTVSPGAGQDAAAPAVSPATGTGGSRGDDDGEGHRTDGYHGADHVEVVQPDRRLKVVLTAAEGELADLQPGLTSLVVPAPAGASSPAVRTAWFTA